jgi:hypothetical protein
MSAAIALADRVVNGSKAELDAYLVSKRRLLQKIPRIY